MCEGVCGEGGMVQTLHPYQLLPVLVGMFCGWILLQCSLARCQHDRQRSESLSHITYEALSARGAQVGKGGR